MSFTFRPAIRESVGLIIGLAGSSGSGKTFSALRLATGLAGDKPFAVIDTENGRALHYADRFRFDHGELRAPFRPDAYADAIYAADMAGYPVIVVDSASHEHAGDGGLLDWHDEELDRMAGDDWKKREACKMAAWINPKGSHKRFVSKLLQVKAHIILCFRAEEKIEIAREDGKTVVRAKQTSTGLNGWVPICEKNLPYEATCSFLLMADHPGIPIPIKLQDQHKPYFPLDRPIDEEAGKLLLQWANGGSPVAPERPQAVPEPAKGGQPAPRPPSPPVCPRTVPDGPWERGRVEVITQKDGQSSKGPYTIFSVKIDGQFYSTFLDDQAALASHSKETGAGIEFQWKPSKDGKYRNLTDIRLAGPPAPTGSGPYAENDEYAEVSGDSLPF